ncbi:MAG: hypothetical protein ACYC9N_13955 [Thermoanaerobaculia bacterium]
MLLLLGLTVACQRSESRYLARTVSPTETHGKWTMTPTGIEGLRYAGHATHLTPADHTLEIRPDGTCSFSGFVDPLKTSGVDEGFVTSECEWRVGTVGHQALMLQMRGQPSSVLGPYFYFDEENQHLLLWQYAGDPDAWRYVEYSRVALGAD